MLAARILVIDDEKNIRRTLSLVLEGEGYEVVSFGSAQEGILFLEKEGADLIILDIKLPGMTGVEALNKIRTVFFKNNNSYSKTIFLIRTASLAITFTKYKPLA